MNILKSYLVLIGLVLLVILSAYAYATPRRLGMGNVGVALGDDIGDFIVNPGADFSDSYAGAETSWLSIPSSDITFTTKLGGLKCAWGYGRQPRIGLSLRWGSVGLGAGLDLNGGYKLSLGTAMDLSPLFLGMAISDYDLMKRNSINVRAGLGINISDLLEFEGDIEQGIPFDNPSAFLDLNNAKWNVGLEADLFDWLSLRGGYNSVLGLSAGIGMHHWGTALDYALLWKDNTFSHSLGFSLSIGPAKKRPYLFLMSIKNLLPGTNAGGAPTEMLRDGVRVDDLLRVLDYVKDDPYCKGILIRVRNFPDSLGTYALVEEVRSGINRLKMAGKYVVFYIDGDVSLPAYYLSTVGNKIYMPTLSNLYGLGVSMDIQKVGDMLRSLGIDMMVFTAGDYKSTFNPLASQMTDRQLKMVRDIVSVLHDTVVKDIARDRHIDEISLEKYLDKGFIDAMKAKDINLVDAIGYYEDVKKDMMDELKVEDTINMEQMKNFLEDKERISGDIAVIPIEGEIVVGDEEESGFGKTTDGAVVAMIRRAEQDRNVKAIILRINSSGGSAIASEHIWHAIDEFKKTGRKVIASLGGIAASGGYYVASAANYIVSEPLSITGSIGVVMEIPKIYDLLSKARINNYSVRDRISSRPFDPFTSLTLKEREEIKEMLQYSYAFFIKRVSFGRSLTESVVKQLAEGRVYTGVQAKEVNLVDRLGDLNTAIEIAKRLSDIRGRASVCYYGHKMSIRQRFILNLLSTFNLSTYDEEQLLEYRF